MERLARPWTKVKSPAVTSPTGFPRRFDSYVLLKPLARGGMGQLYLALTGAPGLEKPCVIKQVLPDLVASENSRRFRDEVMVALRLSHGNMVSVFDAGMQGGQIFLAMEHIEGKDLLATWNRCAERRIPFPVDIAAYIVKEIARALAYAHAFEDLKLVHRDVSPANVMLSYSGEVKLTDFGLAMSILKIERTTPGIVFGKLSYLAPEQARRLPLDGRVDIYAAGILLWELLTGRQLFPVEGAADGGGGSGAADRNIDALARARDPHVVAPSTITSRVPPELDRIVLRALAADREDRYPNAEILRADLAAFLAETAPKTDTERLSGFMRPLFAEDAAEERRERQRLTAAARALLSGGIGAPTSPAAAARPSDGRADGLGPVIEPLADPPRPSDDRPARPGEDPRIGTTLGGRYHIRRLCGEGAMGRVYEGHHVDIGRRVAIKVLHASFHHSADLVERFRREARAASKIGHPNIVDVTDSGTTSDGAFYFVMEYLEGLNLEELIDQNGPLPVERALLVAAQITRALDAAHAAEVIHRDLKPANVMLVNRSDEEDFVKVLDFGISKDLDTAVGSALTRPNVAIGTPVYMAPEQAAGKEANALTDVYGVGGLLYEMLTATPPCVGEDAIEVLQRKAREDPPPVGGVRPDLPFDVQAMVTRALSRAPADRQRSMSALKDEVLACLAAFEDAPAPARAPSSMTERLSTGALDRRAPQPRHPRRVPARRIVLLAASAAVAGLLVGVKLVRRQSPLPAASGAAPIATAPGSAQPAASARARPLAASLPARPRLPGFPMDPVPAREPSERSAAARSVALADSGPAGPRAPASTRRAAAQAPGPRATHIAERASDQSGAPPASLSPASDASATLIRGQLAFDRGDYPEAVRRGREAIAAGAELSGRLLVGDAYYRLERYRDALREYDAALVLDPNNAGTRRRRDLAEKKSGATAAGP
jgi:serine/threonine protein kinase